MGMDGSAFEFYLPTQSQNGHGLIRLVSPKWLILMKLIMDSASKSVIMRTRPMKWLTTQFFALATLVAFSTIALGASQSQEIDFTTQIRPILAENCFKCHGPDDAARKSKLRLDRPDTATQP